MDIPVMPGKTEFIFDGDEITKGWDERNHFFCLPTYSYDVSGWRILRFLNVRMEPHEFVIQYAYLHVYSGKLIAILNNFLRGLISSYGAYKLGGGCIGTVVVFIIIWVALGYCN